MHILFHCAFGQIVTRVLDSYDFSPKKVLFHCNVLYAFINSHLFPLEYNTLLTKSGFSTAD